MVQRLAVLVLDDGELDDIQEMLEGIRVPFGRVRGGAIVPDAPPPRRLLVTTPRRIDAVRSYDPEIDGQGEPQRIVVVEGDSSTLRAKLREVGFDYLVRRPVHPEALRLLLMHAIYAGDERRNEPRVPVGYEISFKSGLLQRRATLVDLSSGGCRLLSTYAVQSGKQIKVQIPVELGATEPITLTGRVLRKDFDSNLGDSGMFSAAIEFEDVSTKQRQELEWILEERAKGPAVMGENITPERDPRVEISRSRLRELKRPPRRPDPRVEPEHDPALDSVRSELEPCQAETSPSAASATPEVGADANDVTHELSGYVETDGIEVGVRLERESPVAEAGWNANEDPLEAIAADPPLSDEDPSPITKVEEEEKGSGAMAPETASEISDDERRASPRAAYVRKVPAFGTRALRVLVGRDLSSRGMRIERFPELEIGDRLHLAIYGEAGEEPFLVWATVERDDAEGGMGLIFDEVHPLVAEQLEKLVASLPAVESLQHGEVGNLGSIVGAVLES
jgi:hypothetical protein